MSTGHFSYPLDDAALEAWLAETLELPEALPQLSGESGVMRQLVGNVREALVPVEPSPSFVRDLGMMLALRASERQQGLRQRYRRAVWFGLAAAGSLASVVGVVAYLYQHERPRA